MARNPSFWVGCMSTAFLVISHGPSNYYLGNDYTYHDGEHMWTYSCKTYCTEAISRAKFFLRNLAKEYTSLHIDDTHLELDKSLLLGLYSERA